MQFPRKPPNHKPLLNNLPTKNITQNNNNNNMSNLNCTLVVMISPSTLSTRNFPPYIIFPALYDFALSMYIIPIILQTLSDSYSRLIRLRNLMGKRNVDSYYVAFEDYFPAMVEKLGGNGFMNELCKGFRLLMDCEKGVITVESLKRNAAVLGLRDYCDDDELLRSMLKEGDLDGDGCLNEREFCVLMFRLSPDLMNGATMLFDHHKLQ